MVVTQANYFGGDSRNAPGPSLYLGRFTSKRLYNHSFDGLRGPKNGQFIQRLATSFSVSSVSCSYSSKRSGQTVLL